MSTEPKKLYVTLPQEAAELNQRFISKLHYDYKRVPKGTGYNATQIGNAVLGDQDFERLRFKTETWIPYRAIAVMSALFALAYLALYFGWLNFLKFLFQ